MGPRKFRNVGKSQWVLIMISPIISTRTRSSTGLSVARGPCGGRYCAVSLLQRHGIGKGEFSLMKRLATKYRAHPLRGGGGRGGRGRRPREQVAQEEWRCRTCTPAAQLAAARAELGIFAKRLLNEGRASWLRRQEGWKSVRLVRYVDEETTPENTLLLGRRYFE
jgi:hypothetical protein